MPLTKAACASGASRVHRRIDHLQADRGVGAQRRIARQKIDPRRARHPIGDRLGIGVGARVQRLQSADRFRPVERVEIVLHAQHRRRVDGLALEDAFVELAAFGHAEDFRQRPRRRVAFEPRHGARRQDQHAVRGLAAERLLPGERRRHRASAQSSGCAKAADVASQIDSPVRSAAIQSALGTRTPDVVPFQVKTMSLAGSIAGEIGQFAIGGAPHGDVFELQLLGDVADPAFAEGFPGQHGHRLRPEQRPERHFDRAGVGGRHDADAVIRRHLQHFAGQIDGALELGLARFRAVRAAKNGGVEILGVPAGALGARAGRKMRHSRPHGRRRERHDLSFQIVAPRWGGVARRRN